MSLKDSRSVRLSTHSATAVAGYERAVELLAGFYLDPLAESERLVAEDPDFVSGHCLRAALGLLATERTGVPLIAASVEAGTRLASRANERELRHLAAAEAWLAGDFHRSNELYGRIALDYPTDLLALQVAHLTDFALGQQRLLRDRPLHALPAWEPSMPGYGFVLGMLAFGLEETNHFERAEAVGHQALELQPKDPWAVHAVAHVHEMNGQVEAGIAWLDTRRGDWASNNTFAFHNFWHLALFHLEKGDEREVLRLFDQHVWPQRSSAALELIDAAALLFRLHLRGVDVASRAALVAERFGEAQHLGYYAFNDVHAAMAMVAAGRLAEARALVAGLEHAAGEDGSNAAMARDVGLPLARALVAFGEGRYAEVVEGLWLVRQGAHRFGGSNAQRDVIDQALAVSAVRAGLPRVAQAVAEERRLLRPHSPWAEALSQRAAA